MLQQRIEKLLLKLGIAPNLDGFRACVYGIEMIVRDESVMQKITGRLYPEVAKKMGKTASMVERNIRHAIEQLFNNQEYGLIVDMLGGINPSMNKGKFTNSQFLSLCAYQIKLES